MIIFPGKVLIELDVVFEIEGSIQVISKNKRKKNKGVVVKGGDKVKAGDKVLFFSQQGQMLDGKVLINESDIVLTLKDNKVKQLFGTRILIEPEKEGEKLVGKLIKGEAQRKLLPFGPVLEVGDEVEKIKVGQRILFNVERAFDLTPYIKVINIPQYKDKIIYIVREADVMAEI